ncbi:MAG: serine hydrolase [Planctomycetota bacterium]|nr:serine hydrolase [Planctomycetota bacterium]
MLTIALTLIPLAVACDGGDEPIVRGELGAEIDEYMSRVEAFGFSGVLLVADARGIVFAKGYGLADREKGIPVGTDTVFTVGSITKQFTGAAILKLEMEGKLSVDDPIAKYLDAVPPDKQAITLHHLLTHTAGLRSDFAETDFTPVGRDEYVRRALASELIAPPGEEHHYANSGYSLLGAIIEQVTGGSYEEYLRAALFVPAGMVDTGYVLPEWEPERLAVGYREGQRWGTIVERPFDADGPYWALRANGGIHSTIGDMYRWHLALLGDELLSAEAKEKLYAPHVAEGPQAQSHYGYGWSIQTTPRGTRLITHNGGNGIFAADFLRYLEDEVTIFIASNNADMSSIRVGMQVRRMPFGERVSMPPKPIVMSAEELDAYAGSYVLPSGATVAVTRDGKRLRAACDGAESFALLLADDPASARRLKPIEARSEEVVRSAAEGNYRPLVEAFGGEMGLDDVAEQEDPLWASLRAKLGEYRGLEVLGANGRPWLARVHVRLDFERGARFLRHGWQDGHLLGIRLGEEPPAKSFVPSSKTSFVDFDPARSAVSYLEFGLDEGANPAELRFRSPGGLVVAKRRP